MNLCHLSDTELIESGICAVATERVATTSVLHNLREVDKRRLSAKCGYSSLWEFAPKVYGYSEGAAHTRIAAMRLLAEFPELEKKIESGEMSLTVAARTQVFFRAEKLNPIEKCDFLETIEGKSSKAVEREIVKLRPRTVLPEKVRLLNETQTELRIVVDAETKALLDDLKSLLSHVDPAMPTPK